MLIMYTPFDDWYDSRPLREMRREIQRERVTESSISSREFERRKRARKIAKASQKRNRRVP